VPGPDGDRGFGGHCFPKDLSAMIKFSEESGITFERSRFLREVKRSNSVYRTEKDWEKMKGRAVSED
jgi:UDP-glucose 6-dehydrogenase